MKVPPLPINPPEPEVYAYEQYENHLIAIAEREIDRLEGEAPEDDEAALAHEAEVLSDLYKAILDRDLNAITSILYAQPRRHF